jgi:hypothetical protein
VPAPAGQPARSKQQPAARAPAAAASASAGPFPLLQLPQEALHEIALRAGPAAHQALRLTCTQLYRDALVTLRRHASGCAMGPPAALPAGSERLRELRKPRKYILNPWTCALLSGADLVSCADS